MALADIKVGGQTIPAGDGAVFASDIGNRDSAALARPVDPDIARGARISPSGFGCTNAWSGAGS
jgi:cytochrome P450